MSARGLIESAKKGFVANDDGNDWLDLRGESYGKSGVGESVIAEEADLLLLSTVAVVGEDGSAR